jgi:hypothetical protein
VKSATLGAVLSATVASWTSAGHAASALSVMAPELARGLGQVPANALVVIGPLTSDAPAPRGEELAVRLASLMAGQLGPTARANPHPVPFSVARALAAKAGALVFVQAEVTHGHFQATADVYPVLSNGWDRVRVPLPAPRSHAFASAPIDAEVRAFLTPLTLEQAQVHKARHDLGDVLAVSCGDVDGEGANELVLVTRKTVARGRIRGSTFATTHRADWSALAPPVPVPLRDPLATSAILARADGTGADLFVGMTDRGGVALSHDLRGAAQILGLPLLAGRSVLCANANGAAGAFEGSLVDCEPGRLGKVDLPWARYDALAVEDLVRSDGTSVRLVAARDPDGRLHLRVGDQEEAGAVRALDHVGAQIALDDLDEDGVAELVTTSDSGDDSITIWSWRGHELKSRLKIAAPSPVRALGVCPSGEKGLRPLVAVVGDEVWLVR